MITSTLFLTVMPIIVSSSLYNSSTVIDNVLFGQIMTGLGEAKQIASVGYLFWKYHLLFNIPVDG